MSILNLNKAVLAGHLTATPELKQTPSGISVTSFSIAVNRRKNADGTQDTDFINIVAWRGTAEFIAKYFKKGSAICVTGSIQTRSWRDQNNQMRYVTEIVADEAMFVDSKNEDPPRELPKSSYEPQQQQTQMQPTPNVGKSADDDLPF